MCNVNVFLLVPFVICRPNAEELAVSQNNQIQESSLDIAAGRMAEKLAKRRHGSFDHRDLDKTTLAKSQSVDLDKTTLGKSNSRNVVSAMVNSGACSLNDEKAMWALGSGTEDGSWPTVCNNCAHFALNIFTGIDPTEFNTCLTGHVAVSTRCSTCFAEASQYAYNECKLECLNSPWTDACQNCAAGFDTQRCAGFDLPQATLGKNEKEDNVAASTGEQDNVVTHTFLKVLHIFVVLMLGLFVLSGAKLHHRKSSSLEGISAFARDVGRHLSSFSSGDSSMQLFCSEPLLAR